MTGIIAGTDGLHCIQRAIHPNFTAVGVRNLFRYRNDTTADDVFKRASSTV
jgi:hypothetical protein